VRQLQFDRGFSINVVTLFGYALITLLRSLPLLLLGGVYLILDEMLGIAQLPTAVLVVCLLSLPCSFLIVYDRSRPTRYAVSAVILVLLLSVSQVGWNSRKAMFRAFYAIRPGMTLAQVDHLMDPPLRSATAVMCPVKLWRTNPDPTTDTVVPVNYLPHTDPGVKVDILRYRPWDRSDLFFVSFVDGRVIERSFSPD
jgi:hypothetical protein